MMMCLQHQRPDGELDSYYLKPGRRYHIGRGSVCEVRILDLKLSRKHCALEFTDNAWHVVDLLSTNGCQYDGQQIVGAVRVAPGGRIEAGQTALIVHSLFTPDAEAAPAGTTSAETAPDTANDHTETTRPDLEEEPLPEGEANHSAASETGLFNRSQEWEPESEPDVLVKTDALIPNRPLDAKQWPSRTRQRRPLRPGPAPVQYARPRPNPGVRPRCSAPMAATIWTRRRIKTTRRPTSARRVRLAWGSPRRSANPHRQPQPHRLRPWLRLLPRAAKTGRSSSLFLAVVSAP